jgi:GNAT superfamily N-acetyltransferase
MTAAPNSAPVTEHVLTIRRLPAGLLLDTPVRLLVFVREDPPFAGPRTGRTLRLTWHVLSALPRGVLPGTVSAVFTPGRRGRPGCVALAPGGLVLAPPLRGCGIGTWLLQQLAAWAATLPAATRVELQGLNPSEPLSPVEEARQRRLREGISAEGRMHEPLTVAGLRLHRRWDSSLTAEIPEAALKVLLSQAPATNYELANYERLTLSRHGEACCPESSALRRIGRGLLFLGSLPFLLLDKLAHRLMGR